MLKPICKETWIVALILMLLAAPVFAQQRIALVIGNSGYQSVSALDNPVNDAQLISQTLTDLGFEVTELTDADYAGMRRGIAQFGRALRNAGPETTGLFYYAGHGVQSFGSNYLLPVDAALADAADLALVAVEAQSVLHQMRSARNRTNIVILDACRNNPFERIADLDSSGLAEMKAPTGTFVAYATSPGAVALDGLDGHSPFTRMLADQMRIPGQSIEQMFKNVRIGVLGETDGAQTPWDASSLTSDFQFAAAAAATVSPLDAGQLWQTVRESGDAVQIMLFLRGYPNSPHAAEARRKLARLLAEEINEGRQYAAVPSQPETPEPDAVPEAERQMFEAAGKDGSRAGYEAYLQVYPDGRFADEAREEIAAIRQSEPEAAPEQPAAPVTGIVTYGSPIDADDPAVAGRTIADLLHGSPLYPPLEGLPETLWKNQNCSNCHQWTQTQLCDQGNTYLTLNMQRSLDKPHPFGGALKKHLRSWAAGGCQ